MELHQVSSSKRAEADSRMAEDRRLEEGVCAAEEDLEVLCVVHVRIDWLTADHASLTADRASLTAGNREAKAELDSLAARIHKLEVAAVTRNERVGVSVQAVRSLKGCVAAGDDRAIRRRFKLTRHSTRLPNFWRLWKG